MLKKTTMKIDLSADVVFWLIRDNRTYLRSAAHNNSNNLECLNDQTEEYKNNIIVKQKDKVTRLEI